MTEIMDIASRIERDKFYQNLTKNPFTRVSVEVTITVIFIILLFLVAIKPTLVTIKQIQVNLENLNSFNEQLTKKITILKKLTTLYQNNLQQFNLLDIAIPQEPEFPLLEKQIRYLIHKNGFEVLTLSFSKFQILGEDLSKEENQKEDNNAKSEKMTLNLAAIGSYESIKSFISQLQSLNRIVTIDSFTITRSTDDNNLNFAINATTYYKVKTDTD